ncbi:MAG: M24 family metallopeptidase [Fimbriimonas sp.]
MKSRIERLAEALSHAGVDAMFAQNPVTMDYLHGFGESSHERFLTLAIRSTGEVRLICPALSEVQARRAGIQDVRTWADDQLPMPIFAELATDWNLRTSIVAVDDELPAHMLLAMQGVLPAALFKPAGPLLTQLMRYKDAQEMDALTRAAKIADDAFVAILPELKVGLSERQIESKLRHLMSEAGGTPTFCIVGIDAGSAEPHHLNGSAVLREGSLLLLDFGCELDGYQSDITRVVAIGRATHRMKEIYSIVHEAHWAARRAVHSGVSGADIDNAARQVIEEAGYGPQFFHRTGHGIGRHGHEEPYIVISNHRPILEGECFSIEPGIYLEGEFGVRIENIVTVGPEGCISLNADPSPTLLELPI